MAQVEFPTELKRLLTGSLYESAIRDLANRVASILADNRLPFFPYFTDHGIAHIESVLNSEVDLVPVEIWNESAANSSPRLLSDADATVLIGATLLHDLAMHLREKGFLELVGANTRFKPLDWFCESHEGYASDRPWPELWDDFVREAKRFSVRDLGEIVGEESARHWAFDGLDPDTAQWEENDRLVVGEFIRRHHARLAHEIAFFGFPGIQVGSELDCFPAIAANGHPLESFANLIGLTARSHGMPLRVCQDYIQDHAQYAQTPRPMGTAVLYSMSLLRVADYLQIDRRRAPAVLLQLRDPQSPITVAEWEKHLAIEHIGPANDPRARFITVKSDIPLSMFLQLRQLLESVQAEIDQCTAVLDEAYGTRTDLGIDRLNLSVRRVRSNLTTPAFLKRLPYVPEATGFSTDPNLLALLVEPLYGKQPSVGVRELIQNAVDAVRERAVWCDSRGISIDALDIPHLEGDVVVDFVKHSDGQWILRIQDTGIGMTCETIEKYFLCAGATFRNSSQWAREFADDDRQPRVTRSGRFGIGVFATFLLGPSFQMHTRYVTADTSEGYTIDATNGSRQIEIRRSTGLPIGTTIEVQLDDFAVKSLDLNFERGGAFGGPCERVSWYCWDWPSVVTRVQRGRSMTTQRASIPLPIE